MCFRHKYVLFLPTGFYFHGVIGDMHHSTACWEWCKQCVSSTWTLPRPRWRTSVIQPLQQYEMQQVRHKTAFSLMAEGLRATYLHKQRGHKSSSLESFVLKAKRSAGRRFIWLYHICFRDAAIIPLRCFSGPLHLITHWLRFSKNENVPFISFIFACLQVFLKHTGRRQSDEYLIWANVEKWMLKND